MKNMQKQNQGAIFAFNMVGSPYDCKLPHQAQLIYSQVVLGSLFVKSYKMLTKNKVNLYLTFVRKVQKQSQYLFLKFIESSEKQTKEQQLEKAQQQVNAIQKIKGSSSTFNYKILIADLSERTTSEYTKEQFEFFIQKLKEKEPEANSKEETMKNVNKIQRKSEGTQKQNIDDQCKDLIDGYQLEKIKAFVWSYLDTFGQKYKDNLYYQFQKQSKSHLSIDRIIDTVNWIVYCQTVGKPFNQLESSNWTCFQAQSKQKCKSDRKQIVFTGSGTILYIPLLFICQKLQNYKRQCERQLFQVMQESKKYYSQGQIKVYLITDKIDEHNLLYFTQSASLYSYPDKKIIH